MYYIWKVTITYSDGSSNQLHVKAITDVKARDEAIRKDSMPLRVMYCEIVKICHIDNEE